MQLSEIVAYGSGSLFILLTLIQIAPIKIDPWSSIAKLIGKAINSDVLNKLDIVETRLDKHIHDDDERNADYHRSKILEFNTELLRNQKHTEEDFIEIMYHITYYERYCQDHDDYKNNRAVHAISNINRVYDERMAKRDFLNAYLEPSKD